MTIWLGCRGTPHSPMENELEMKNELDIGVVFLGALYLLTLHIDPFFISLFTLFLFYLRIISPTTPTRDHASGNSLGSCMNSMPEC